MTDCEEVAPHHGPRVQGDRGYRVTTLRTPHVREYPIELEKTRTLKNGQQRYQIVYIDESYVHVNHEWRSNQVDDDDEVVRGDQSGGQRVTIVHASSKDGPLVAPEFHGAAGFPRGEGWLRELRTSTARAGRGSGRGQERRRHILEYTCIGHVIRCWSTIPPVDTTAQQLTMTKSRIKDDWKLT